MKINIKQNLQTSHNAFFSAIGPQPSVKINKIIVPIYQREYDWKDDEILRLLTDLDSYISGVSKNTGDENESYFTGAVILEKLKSKGVGHFFEVVDG